MLRLSESAGGLLSLLLGKHGGIYLFDEFPAGMNWTTLESAVTQAHRLERDERNPSGLE